MTGSRKSIGRTIGDRPAAAGRGGRSPRRFAAGLGLFVTLAALMATLGAASASAYECFEPSENCSTQKLDPTSGIYMPTTTTYFVYWAPKGAPKFPAGYASGIKTFFKGLEHDNGTDQNFYSVLAQYNVKYETHLGKAINDKHPYPAESSECAARPSSPCVSLVQIKEEMRALVKEGKLPGQTWVPGPSVREATRAYFVLLPPGVSACDVTRVEPNKTTHVGVGCSSVQYCGLHDFNFNPENELEDLPYAVMPYLPGVNGCDSKQHPNGISDGELEVIEHEFAETITNPFNAGWENTLPGGGEEVADICVQTTWSSPSEAFHEKMAWGTPLGTAPNGALYNQVIDGRYYYLQQLYSNEAQGCRQRRGLPPTVTKLAPAKGKVAGGKKVKITGLNFVNPTVTSVSFGSVPAKEFTVNSPTSITAVSPASASTGIVKVTLTTSAGTNASTTSDQYTYE